MTRPRLLEDLYQPEPNSGCWLWLASVSKKGYGHMGRHGRQEAAHRVFYKELRGPIPAGLELDHKCNIRSCVNPDHLEQVTHAENIRRSHYRAKGPGWELKCANGHFWSEETAYYVGGKRFCRVCSRIRMRDKYRREHGLDSGVLTR